MREHLQGLTVLFGCAASLGAGCGSDGGGAPRPAPGEVAGPAYAIATCIESPDSSTGYVVTVDSLAAGAAPDLASALAIPGCGVISGPEGGGTFYVGEGESPTVRRYRVEGGTFVADGALSLAGLGITDAFYSQPHFVYLGETKAYIISGKGAPEVIVWNPQTMELVKTIPIDGLERGGTYPAFSYAPQLIDGRLYVTARWRNDGGFLRENALVVIDTASDAVLGVATDARCGDFLYAVRGAGGDVYFSNGNYASAFRLALGEAAAPPACILRVRAGQTAFDPDYQVDLSALVGGREAGGLMPGPDGAAFVQAFHDEAHPVGPGTEWSDLFGVPAWRWWRLSPGFDAATEVGELPFTAAAFDPFAVDGRTYSTLAEADFSETTFLDVTAPGGVPAAGRTVPGFVFGVVRVR